MSKKMKLPTATATAAFTGIIVGFVSLVSTNFSEIHFQRDDYSRVLNSIYQEWNSTNYCGIEECRAVNCRDISEEKDVGIIISHFISSIFHTQCPHEKQISSLKLKNCSFPEGKLQSSWLTTEYSVIDLIFEDCGLSDIEKNAFSSSAFENTKRLGLINTGVKKLKKYVFESFRNLVSLTIRNNLVEEAEFNLLENVADILEDIELNGSIKNDQVLRNMTSGSKLLKVELMSMEGNNISQLSPEILSGFPNARSIYLDSSQIKSIDADAFQSLKSAEQIYLRNNLLSTLHVNTFNNILLNNSNLRIMMSGNPWNCSCPFVWIQRMTRSRPNLLENIPKCVTPERNSGLNFLDADFCDDPESTSVASTSEPLTEENNCLSILRNENTLLHFQLPTKIAGFYIEEYYSNGSVFVHIEASSNPQGLIWFRNSHKKISHTECLTAVNNSIILDNVQKNSVYTVCLLDIMRGPSPLNCLAMAPALARNRIWLETDDKPVTIVLILFITSLSFIIGGVVSFLIILKNPHLIRGNPRVIMVKRGQVNAMILPKGVLWHKVEDEEEERGGSDFKDHRRPEYLTPISRTRNLVFEGHYYDSIRKSLSHRRGPSGRSLWRNKNCVSSYDVPPPLPPYPKQEILNTLSQAVERLERSSILES